MPRFLDTFTGEFVWVEDPSTVSYAILSHTWRSPQDGGEQSYAQVREIYARTRRTRTKQITNHSEVDQLLSDPELSTKIQGICKVARDAGYRLVWIDTCCIDKTSSAELAEAINSMFELYRLAEVCYVYLVDVPDGEEPRDRHSKFYKSRWHTRGWTLQELIAPKRVVFLTATWTFFTTKMAIAATLADFSGIDVDILTGQATLATISVARKMSWAARRETTRIEDEAYSLLGIFGIHLSPIYGEGHNAFLRLQEEILRTVPDHSIFAWGPRCTLRSLDGTLELGSDEACPCDSGLLAQSARSFAPAHSVDMLSPSKYASLLHAAWPRRCTTPPICSIITPQGIRITLVCIDLPQEVLQPFLCTDESDVCGECLKLGRARRLALLPCIDQHECLIALPLFLSAHNTDDELTGTRLATHARCTTTECPSRAPYRALRLGREACAALSNKLSPEFVEVNLRHHEVFRPSSTVFDRRVLIPLWPSFNLDDESSSDVHSYLGSNNILAEVQLAPECAQAIPIAPLVTKRSDDGRKLTVTTLLSTGSLIPHSMSTTSTTSPARESTLDAERCHHHLEVAITLTHTPGRTRAGGASVSFTINNFIYASPSRSRDSMSGGDDVENSAAASDAHSFCPACCGVDHDDDTRQPAPGVISFVEGCRDAVFDCSPRERVLAEIEGVVYVGSRQQWDLSESEDARLPMRVVRLSLECREVGLFSRERIHEEGEGDVVIPKLWLSVELSETFYRMRAERLTLREGSAGTQAILAEPLPGPSPPRPVPVRTEPLRIPRHISKVSASTP